MCRGKGCTDERHFTALDGTAISTSRLCAVPSWLAYPVLYYCDLQHGAMGSPFDPLGRFEDQPAKAKSPPSVEV
jgi:hypothetical protein